MHGARGHWFDLSCARSTAKDAHSANLAAFLRLFRLFRTGNTMGEQQSVIPQTGAASPRRLDSGAD
jgi:hypothetical protein